MELLNAILLVFGIIGFVEGLLVSFSSKWIQKMIKKFSKNKETIKKAGIIEAVISIVLITLSVMI